MPTIFELLDNVNTGELTTAVDGQVDQLNTVVTLVSDLAENPPGGIADVISTIQDLGFPDIPLGDDLPSALADLHAALPTDLSSVTNDLTGSLSSLGETVGGELLTAVQQGLGPILAVARLLELDFTCENEDRDRGTRTRAPGDPNSFITTVDQADAIVSAVPAPLTVDAVVTLLARVLDGPLGSTIPVPIPFVDNLREPLITAVRWRGMQPNQITAELAETVAKLEQLLRNACSASIDALAAELTQLPQQAHTQELAVIADGLAQALAAIGQAVDAGDLATTPAAISAATPHLDQLDAIRTQRAGKWNDLLDRVRRVPAEIDDRVSAIEGLLANPAPFPSPDLFNAADALAPIPDTVRQAIDQAIAPALGWLTQVVGQLDLSVVQEPIEQVATTVREAVEQVEEGLAAVTTQVQALFGQVEDLIDQVDIQALVDRVKGEVTEFCNGVTHQLEDLFAPVKELVTDAVGEISSAVDGFDPTTIVDGLKSVVQSITDVLADPDVTSAIGQIKAAFDGVAEQLKSLSFTPVTEQVVGVIDQITAALRALDPAILSPPLQIALNGAVAILPGDLTPVTEPLVEEFGELVNEGPARLIEAAQAPVGQLLDRVRRFEPAGLIGDTLDGPFQTLITTIEGFKPSNLLTQIDAELGGLKDKLTEAANPAQLLAPLQDGFDALVRQFDKLEPSEIVKPVNDALQQVVQQAIDAVPIDDLLEPVNAVFARIQQFADAGTKLVGLLDKVKTLLESTQDLPAQVEGWVDEVAATVGGLANTQAIHAATSQLAAAAEDLRAANLTAKIDEALTPAVAAVDDLDAHRRLTQLVEAYREVSTRRLNNLPDSPEKQAVKDFLQRINPTKAPFSEPFDNAAELQDRLHEARDAVNDAFTDWDDRHVAPGTVLAGLAALDTLPTPTTTLPADLSTWIGDTLRANVVPPVRALLGAIAPVAAFIGPLQTHLGALVTELTTKLTSILTGEGSIGAITGAIDRLLDDLRGIDLGFLTDALDEVFTSVRAKFMALSPDELAQPIGQAFADALDTLSIGSVLSDTDRQKLDDDFHAIVDKLTALNPKTLVIDAVQPEFEEKVLPMLDAFDVAALLQALLDGLHGLEADLRTELGDVNDAYKAMLAAVPPIDPLALAGDLGDVAGAVGDAVGGLF